MEEIRLGVFSFSLPSSALFLCPLPVTCPVELLGTSVGTENALPGAYKLDATYPALAPDPPT